MRDAKPLRVILYPANKRSSCQHSKRSQHAARLWPKVVSHLRVSFSQLPIWRPTKICLGLRLSLAQQDRLPQGCWILYSRACPGCATCEVEHGHPRTTFNKWQDRGCQDAGRNGWFPKFPHIHTKLFRGVARKRLCITSGELIATNTGRPEQRTEPEPALVS